MYFQIRKIENVFKHKSTISIQIFMTILINNPINIFDFILRIRKYVSIKINTDCHS